MSTNMFMCQYLWDLGVASRTSRSMGVVGEGKTSGPTLKRLRVLSLIMSIPGMFISVSAEISHEAVELGHCYGNNNGVWAQLMGLWQSRDLAHTLPRSPQSFQQEISIPRNFSSMVCISSKM